MILYIHGFESDGNCVKCTIMKKNFAEVSVPTLNLLDVQETIAQLETFCQKGVSLIMGASLGGYYAHLLAIKYQVPLIVINPLVNPLLFLDQVELPDSMRKEVISNIKLMDLFKENTPYTQEVEALFGLNDESIDLKKSYETFAQYPCKFYDDDHHLYEGFNNYILQTDTLLSKFI